MADRIANLIVETLKAPEDGISPQLRSAILKQDALRRFPVPFVGFRVWDAVTTLLPSAAANDDLGLINGTWGTHPLLINAGDVKATSSTRRARCELIVPECYQAGETFNVIISAGMVTTVADGSCTVDLEVYKRDKITGISSDLCATNATSINSLTFGDKSFTITPTTLSPGDVLDCRLSIIYVDTATATAVTPTIGGFDIACDIQG